MKYKKIMLILITAIFLVSIAGACAADANDTLVASEDNLEIDQTTDDAIDVEEDTNLASGEENEILTADEQTFTQLNATINGNADRDIYLNGNYKYSGGDDSFKGGIVINRDVNVYGNGATIDGNYQARIFQISGGNVVFYNITFVNGNAGYQPGDNGGAINGNCKAINCIFIGNKADYEENVYGGAMCGGSAVNCIFSENAASAGGGAMYGGSAVNCTFTGNDAYNGGAMYEGSAVNCVFNFNHAGGDGGAMIGSSALNCTFSKNTAYMGGAMETGFKWKCIGQDNNDYVLTDDLVLYWDANDFTTVYGSAEKLPIQLINQLHEPIDFIDYDVVIYKNGSKVKTYHCLSNDGLSLDLAAGTYTAELIVTYPGLDKPDSKNITLTINKATPKIEVSASDVSYPNNVVVIVKSDVKGIYAVKVGDISQNVTLEANVSKSVAFGLNANEMGYFINVTPDSENCIGFNDTVSVKVKKGSAILDAGPVTATYNVKKNLVITLKDGSGNALGGVKLTVKIKGAKTYTTDNKGQIKINVAGLVPKSYTAEISFAGNASYTAASANAKVTVKKAKPIMIAKKKTFKVKKAKKYTITLKTNKKKALKKGKVTLTVKVKGKKIKITKRTGKKGKATFNLKRLTKKGTFKATVTFRGDAYYKKAVKKVKIQVK